MILPSHKAAYRDVNVDVKKVVSAKSYETVMESLGLMAYEMSDRVKYATGDSVAMESMRLEPSGNTVSARNKQGTVIVPLEKKVKDIMHSYMKDFNF